MTTKPDARSGALPAGTEMEGSASEAQRDKPCDTRTAEYADTRNTAERYFLVIDC